MTTSGKRGSGEQLRLDVPGVPEDPLAGAVGGSGARTYWEHRGPGRWEPVTVRARYGSGDGPRPVVFPEVRTAGSAPRNVLGERADGTANVRPVRLLRTRRPG